MKQVEHIKTQKIINKIESGNFDENDVEILYMKLRPYSYGNIIFREIADFVAHNDERNKGLAVKSLKTMSLMMKYFINYPGNNKKLDISKEFPMWIKELLILQVDKLDLKTIRTEFKSTSKKIKSLINNSLIENEQNNMVIIENISDSLYKILKYLLGRIISNPIFTQEKIIDETLNVLKKNKIDINISNYMRVNLLYQ